MKYIIQFASLILLVIVLLVGCNKNRQANNAGDCTFTKPNLIVIMADDLGYADVGFNGCKDIPTPNIDRLANNGVVFTDAYTAYSVCSPSRAGFITGRYPQRFGYERNAQYRVNDPNMGLSKDETTLASFLKKSSYKSSVIGKWHLGAHVSNHPLNRGFDEFYGHLGGGHRYFPEELVINDSYAAVNEPESYRTWIMRNHDHEKTDEYLTDEFSNEAVHFVERHKDEPFFLYLSYNAPHAPLQASEKYLSRFSHISNTKRKIYAAMVSAVDDGVGRVLDKLIELGIEENTMIYFLSDNGGPEQHNASDNGILREGKGSVYEGGFRVPFVLQYKAKLNKGVYSKPVSALDIFATMAVESNTSANMEKALDGVNILPFVLGENKGIPHETIYLRKFDQKRYAVRHGNYKLVTLNDGATRQLYNLQDDVSEQNDIIKSKPVIESQIESLRQQWNSELIDPVFLGLIHTDAWQKSGKKKK